jgi:hypothetical protein
MTREQALAMRGAGAIDGVPVESLGVALRGRADGRGGSVEAI